MLDLIDEFLEIEEDKKEVWKVTDDVSADWCLDKIMEYKAEFNRFEIVAKAKIQQIEMSLKKEKNKMNNDVSFFESKLREYFESVKEAAKDSKTQKVYKLPSGSLKMKKAVVTFDYDKAKLLEYAEKEKLDDLIKTTKEFKWAEFKKNLEIEGKDILNKETGEIVEIEGLKLETKPEEFNVEV